MSQKSYNQTPTLYLIPTPIGNLDDMTYRAVKILNEVDVIFSEDTRVTKELLHHFNIQKKCIASHDHNEATNKVKLLSYLEAGNNVGLVSDRGTPVISDPGEVLARTAISAGYNVVGLPGATALIPALITSGIETNHFMFYGFLDHKEGKRKKELEELKDFRYTLIFYEAPHRIEKTLKNMLDIFGNRKVSLSREISKKYEEIYRGTLTDILKEIPGAKGEMVLVVEGNKYEQTFDHLTITEHVNLYIKEGKTSKEAIKLVAQDRHLPKSEVYNAYHIERS